MNERTVLVEGVRMTKVALEKALQEIESPTLNAGDIVQRKNGSDTRYVVVSKSTRRALERAYGFIDRDTFSVISLSDGSSYSSNGPEDYERVTS